MMRNIELKAVLKDMEAARSVCRELGARDEGELSQADTYFHVDHGRLKLRDFGDGRAELIAYHRPDLAQARASDYEVQPVSPALCGLLAGALGIRTVVRKMRELYLWKNVRIHLDQVEGLGCFIEFEAVLDDQYNERDGGEKLKYLRGLFALAENDIISGSYADMTLQGSHPLDRKQGVVT